MDIDRPALRLLGWLPTTLLVAVLAMILGRYSSLPDTIPTHFNGRGVADGFGPKATLLILPAIGLVLELVMALVSRHPEMANFPVKVTDENRERLYELYGATMLYTRVCTAALLSTIAVGTIQAVGSGAKGLNPVYLYFWLLALLGGSVGWLVAMVRAK